MNYYQDVLISNQMIPPPPNTENIRDNKLHSAVPLFQFPPLHITGLEQFDQQFDLSDLDFLANSDYHVELSLQVV